MTIRSWRYPILRALSLGVFACLGSIATTDASAASWTVTQVDNSADVGKYAAIAADAGKKLHVSYFDTTGKLKYATNKSGSWGTPSTVVSSGVIAAGTAIAVDDTGNPQINYYFNASQSNRGLRNIAFSGSVWGTPANINGSFLPSVDQSTSIFSKNGTSYVTMVKNAGSLASLAYIKNNTPYNYSVFTGPVTLDNTDVAGTNNSVVVDSSDYIHAVGYNSTSTDLFYFTNSSGAWVRTTVATSPDIVGKWCSLAIDGSNNLHLAYFESTSTPASYRIKYRFKPAGGAWQDAVDVGDAGSLGGYTSIAVDDSGNPHISYYYSTSSTAGRLRYANNLGGTWTSEDVDAPTGVNVGRYSAITVDSSEVVSIAYYDVTNSALKVAVGTVSSAISFGTVDRGFQSATSDLTVTNDQAVAVTFGSLAKAGINADEFSIDRDACSNVQLAPAASCLIQLHFAPTAAAPRSAGRSAALSLPRSAPYSALSYQLTGITSDKFLVTASAGNGGSISPAKAAVVPGGSQGFSVSADAGFSVASVVADGTTPLSAPYALSNVNADHSVVASLVSPIRVLESSIFYGSLQSAFSTMNNGWTLQSQQSVPAGDLLVDRDISVTLSGGYDNAFASQSGRTSIPGSITVSNGTLSVENIEIQ